MSSAPRSALAGASVSCKIDDFPETVQDQLKADLASWKIQEPDDLTRRARERWQAEKPLRCPGLAIGKFERNDASGYAVLLVPRNRSMSGHKFLIFGPMERPTAYRQRAVDQSNGIGSGDFFIRTVAIGKFFDAASRIKFRVQTPEGILLVDAGEKEYEADIYFWTNGKYEQQPVDY
jgi:hypothetical protein